MYSFSVFLTFWFENTLTTYYLLTHRGRCSLNECKANRETTVLLNHGDPQMTLVHAHASIVQHKHKNNHTFAHTHTDLISMCQHRLRADAKMHMVDRMLADKHIINAVLQQG